MVFCFLHFVSPNADFIFLGVGCLLVFKFVEHPENNEKPMDQKSRVKFKIMSLKVKGPVDYVSELVCLSLLLFILFSLISLKDSFLCYSIIDISQRKLIV